MSNYCGIILAAGSGSRIRPLSFDFPKPLLPVLNKPIIQYQIEYLKQVGITDVVVVCGHLQEKLHGFLGDGSSLGVKIRYVRQERPLGIAHALSAAEPSVDRPFVLFLGDVFFATRRLSSMLELLEQRGAAAVLAVKREDNQEYIRRNYTLILHQSGLVQRVIEKPRHSMSNLKGCGLYAFDLSVFDAIRNTPRTAMRNEYELTSSIQILIDSGYPVFPAEVIEWDMNITTIQDLWLSNLKMLGEQNDRVILGRNLHIHPGAQISRSVIGDNVSIKHPIRIHQTVILEGSDVSAERMLDGVLIHDNRCYPEQGSFAE